MKNAAYKTILVILFSSLVSCSEQAVFTDKKNLNQLMNSFLNGKFYSCNFEETKYKNKIYKDTLIDKNISINKNINLIHTEKFIGLIYKRDKWNNGNTIYNKNAEKENSFTLGSFYHESDFDFNEKNNEHNLDFKNNKLYVSLFSKEIRSKYNCNQLHEILSEAMKKQLLKNFLLQKNEDRY